MKSTFGDRDTLGGTTVLFIFGWNEWTPSLQALFILLHSVSYEKIRDFFGAGGQN